MEIVHTSSAVKAVHLVPINRNVTNWENIDFRINIDKKIYLQGSLERTLIFYDIQVNFAHFVLRPLSSYLSHS
jgi:hypothetical protein